jgi:hypothetical protein
MHLEYRRPHAPVRGNPKEEDSEGAYTSVNPVNRIAMYRTYGTSSFNPPARSLATRVVRSRTKHWR